MDILITRDVVKGVLFFSLHGHFKHKRECTLPIQQFVFFLVFVLRTEGFRQQAGPAPKAVKSEKKFSLILCLSFVCAFHSVFLFL